MKPSQKFVSPNTLFKSSKGFYLEGRDPKTKHEWAMLVNFWAFNVSEAEEEICLIMKLLFNCPLSEEMIRNIARFQVQNKRNQQRERT